MDGTEALTRLLAKLDGARHGYDLEDMDADMAYSAAIASVCRAIEEVLRDVERISAVTESEAK